MIKILQYNFLTLSRFKISKYQFAPEYIGFFIATALFSVMFIGVSSEEPLIVYEKKYMNFNIIALFYFIAPILSDIFMFKFYDPNYQYFKLLYPFKTSKIIFIDTLVEIFSYKILFILCFLIAYIPFCLTYDLILSENISFIGFFLIITTYINSCLFIRIIKDLIKNKVQNSHKNYLKLFIVLIFILMTFNENYNLIDLDNSKTVYIFFNFSLISILTLIVILYFINVKYDRV